MKMRFYNVYILMDRCKSKMERKTHAIPITIESKIRDVDI